MDMQKYSELAIRTANELGKEGNLIHATLGITSEAGEIADLVKKNVAYGKPLNRDLLIEEMGDEIWFLNLMIRTLDTTWEEVCTKNINKLAARYPDLKFNAEHALNRDKEAERLAMEYTADSVGVSNV